MALKDRLLALAQAVGADIKAVLARNGGRHGIIQVASGGYVSAALNATALGTIAGTALRVDYYPFVPARDIAISELAIEVTTVLAGSTGYAGIYADNGGKPDGGALLAGGVTSLNCATTGVKTQAVSPAVTLTKGTTYWLAVLFSGTQTLRGIALAALMPIDAPASGTAQNTVRRATLGALGALAGTAPATTAASAIAPWVRMKVA